MICGNNIDNVLYIESGHFPFGKQGRNILAKNFSDMVKNYPNVNFIVKPRFLENEGHLGKHRNSDHLYNYIRENFKNKIPNNLKLLNEHADMKQLINNSDCVMCTYSSAHIEAIYAGKRIINITDVPSEETADFRINRFKIITQIIDKANCNISIYDLKNSLEKAKIASKEYFKYVIEEPLFSTRKSCDIIEKALLKNNFKNYPNSGTYNVNSDVPFENSYEDIVKRRYQGWVHRKLSYYENRFDNFGEFDYIRYKLFDTINKFNIEDNINFLTNIINNELLQYIKYHCDDLMLNKFNRSVVYDFLYDLKLYNELYNLLIKDEQAKDVSYYLYMGLVSYQKGDINIAIRNLKLYLELVERVQYETVNAEKFKYIELAKSIIANNE